VIVPNAHPALIGRETFEKVQGRLAGNRARTTPAVGGGEFLLSSMMVCGHCGARMVAERPRGRRDFIGYQCNGYRVFGKAVCNRNWVKEPDVVPCIVRRLQEDFLNPDNLANLRAELKRQAEQAHRIDPVLGKRLRAKAADLDSKIRQGSERLAVVPLDMVQALSETIRRWKAERDAVARELDDLERVPDMGEAEREVDAAEAYLWQLREGLENDDPVVLRAVLREMVSKVELWWEHRPRGPHTVSTLSRGLIHVRADEEIVRLVNPSRA
jgi:hypothetical protein